MQIEDFFIQKYEELEKRCLQAEAAVRQQDHSKYGVTLKVLEKNIVKVTVQSYYSLFESTWGGVWKNKSMEQLANMNMSPQYLEQAGIITVERDSVIGSITKRDVGATCTVYLRPTLDTIDIAEDACLETWCWAADLDEVASLAIDELQKQIDKRVAALAEEEEGSTDE